MYSDWSVQGGRGAFGLSFRRPALSDMSPLLDRLRRKTVRMNECGFEGRVAVVTGAGRGIGRAHARLLAERGASVVVNDLGGSMEGVGVNAAPASTVAAEIVAAGGVAVGDNSDVASEEGAKALVDTAVERFGRLDILVNNAGIIRWAGFPEADAANLASHLAVHVGGSFNTTRAAWPRMVEQGYGRIVMTTSSGMFGLPNNLSYATAKAAVIGLTRSLSTAGAAHGIKINAIAPAAMTRMAGQPADDSSGAPQMSPDLVAPMVAFLAHEACPVSGEVYAAGAGRFARIFIASTEGYVHPTPEPTLEDVAEHWATINEETGYDIPANLMGWSAAFMAHLSG
jgi:NAD(P)-dependent dehydrogenase (short-subunit alcohol dehydrogenase family)